MSQNYQWPTLSASTPVGGATAANQVLEIAQLTAINANTSGLGNSIGTPGSAVPADATYVAGNKGGLLQPFTLDSSNNLFVNVAASVLPTGAATASNQTTGNTSLSTIATNTTGVSTAANQVTGNGYLSTIATNTTGAATAANQVTGNSTLSTISGQLPASLGQKAASGSLSVVLASGTPSIPISQAGRSTANAPVYNVYSSTNITTSAYVQLVASTANAINYLDIFDSSGQAMIIGVGAMGSEVIQGYVPPGGDEIPLAIPAGSRIAYKALTANATAGYLLFNMYT